MKYIRIKNWKKHQHYKGRRPPWIKLHTALLDDYEFECLQDDSKLHLICIWLLASRSKDLHLDGDPLLPEDEQYLTNKAGLKKKIDLTPLFTSGFIVRYQPDSNMIAERYQPDSNMIAECKQLVPTDLDLDLKLSETETEKPSSSDDDRPPNKFSPKDMMRLWNEGIEFYSKDREVLIPKIQKLTDERKKKALSRIKDCQINEARWRSVINAVHQSAFLSGKSPSKDHADWSANFDFVIRSQTVLMKILEGGYR